MTLHGRIRSAEELGRMLQQGRLLTGISQRQLAEKLGTSQRYIWELESGKPSVLMTRLFQALRETGVSLSAEVQEHRPDDGNE